MIWKRFNRDYLLQLTVGGITLLGNYLGSTSLSGVPVCLAAAILWNLMMIRQRLWGLIPVNVGGLAIALVNLYRVWHK